MPIPKEHEQEFSQFPAVLRDLVIAELADGNEVAEFAHGFPAAPCGAYIKLERAVTTRPRISTPELHFYDRDSSSYAGEFTDDKRHFFVLEPPHPPAPPPDMDAIRAAHAISIVEPVVREAAAARIREGAPILDQFRASMVMDYDKWHDGIGYDLSILSQASAEDLKAIEALVIGTGVDDWRDVEALAALQTVKAKAALKKAFAEGSTETRMAIHHYAPGVITAKQRVRSLVNALSEGDAQTSLTKVLMEVEELHPPEVVQALLQGLIERDGKAAVHFAAMLYYLHGKADEPFDWTHRPFFLRFNTDDRAKRIEAARELCATIGVDPQVCLRTKR